MSTWPSETLDAIASSDDLHIAPFRADGATYGTLTWIWSVVVDGELYVRAYNGTASRWYQAAARQRAGRISAAGAEHEVTFEFVEHALDDLQHAIDDAYRAKYTGSAYLAAMIAPRARSATVRLLPR